MVVVLPWMMLGAVIGVALYILAEWLSKPRALVPASRRLHCAPQPGGPVQFRAPCPICMDDAYLEQTASETTGGAYFECFKAPCPRCGAFLTFSAQCSPGVVKLA